MPPTQPPKPTKREILDAEAAERKRTAHIEAMRDRSKAPEPTEYLPGSKEKIEVMAWRVAHGYAPFHPLDAKRSEK